MASGFSLFRLDVSWLFFEKKLKVSPIRIGVGDCSRKTPKTPGIDASEITVVPLRSGVTTAWVCCLFAARGGIRRFDATPSNCPTVTGSPTDACQLL